jgi:hypothetical protein
MNAAHAAASKTLARLGADWPEPEIGINVTPKPARATSLPTVQMVR